MHESFYYFHVRGGPQGKKKKEKGKRKAFPTGYESESEPKFAGVIIMEILSKRNISSELLQYNTGLVRKKETELLQ